jgi:hypothetical protein
MTIESAVELIVKAASVFPDATTWVNLDKALLESTRRLYKVPDEWVHSAIWVSRERRLCLEEQARWADDGGKV